MGFSCIKDNEVVYSFQLSTDEWINLKSEQKNHDLSMPCCGEQAILKTSALGTQFFAHKTKSESCPASTNGESREHQFAKYLVSKTLFEMGWHVETEKVGHTPDGQEWVADIYAERGIAKMAVEIQWSPQSYIETAKRQEIYRQSGVRCVWLLRDSKANNCNALTSDYMNRTKDLPVFTLVKNKDNSMRVHNIYVIDETGTNLNSKFNAITLELTDFIRELFSKNFTFLPRQSVNERYLSLELIKDTCWKCHKETVSVGRVNYKQYVYGLLSDDVRMSNRTIREIPQEHIDIINQFFQPVYNFAKLKNRFSKTENGTYMANSCSHCDALMGKFFEENMYYEYEKTNTQTLFNPAVQSLNESVMDVGEWILNPNNPNLKYENDEFNGFRDRKIQVGTNNEQRTHNSEFQHDYDTGVTIRSMSRNDVHHFLKRMTSLGGLFPSY